MNLPPLLAVPLLGLLALAGCASGPDAPAPLGTEPVLVTDATDTSRLSDAGLHLHDYWAGATRRVVHEEARESGGLISSCQSWSWEMFRPKSGSTVLQGTATVEVTLRWTDGTGDLYSAPELRIKTAADSAPRRVQTVRSGETIHFAAQVNESDLPHALLSNWQFHWYLSPGNPNDPFCSIRFSGQVSIKVEIVRGHEIPLFPGHPDPWKNATSLPILQSQRDVRFYHGPKPPAGGLCLSDRDGNCLWKPHVPKNGTLVPYNASRISLTVRNQGLNAFPLALAYHGADQWELTFEPRTIPPGASTTFEIALKPNEGDGPYAVQSLWEFWIYPAHATQVYAGPYSIEASAHAA